MSPKKRKRRRKIGKPRVAVIFFTVILLYIAFYTITYISKEKISVYEVYAGSISTDNVFTGIALREEQIFNSQYSGNVNYFLREGERAAVGTTVYTVDETGRVAAMIESLNAEDNGMSSSNLSIVRNSMSNFKEDYTDTEFYKLYDLKNKLETTVSDSVNENIINNLDMIIKNTGSDNLFKMIKAIKTGVVVYNIDGYEDLTIEKLTTESYDETLYERTNLRAEDIIVSGSPVYKQITSEDWSIVIRLTDSMIKDYSLAEKKQVRIRFVKEDITTYANFRIVTTAAGTFGELTLSKYMIQFANERFIDIELLVSAEDGLKIPTSSVITKDFYLIPKEFAAVKIDPEKEVTIETATGERTVKEAKTEAEIEAEREREIASSSKLEFVYKYVDSSGTLDEGRKKCSVYAIIDDMIYVDMKDFRPGEQIYIEESMKQVTISATDSLEGVYCINMGYAVFKRIERIDENSEYIIIKKNTKYGLSTYDHIILNGSTVSEDQIIY